MYKSSIDLFLYVVGSSYENEVNSGVGVTERVCPWGVWLGVWGRSWVLGSGANYWDPKGSGVSPGFVEPEGHPIWWNLFTESTHTTTQ